MRQFLFLVLCLSLSTKVRAWGTIGHRVVGKLAEDRLSETSKKKVRELLGRETLADVANWPDWIKSDPAWKHAGPWHYMSIADGQKLKSFKHGPQGDIYEAIQRFTKELKDQKLPKEKRREALAFLVHLIGDVHMPLHVGRGDDAGGNKIELKWFGKRTNLHEIWDEKIIEMERMSYSDYAAWVDKASAEEEKVWRKEPLEKWLEESQSLRPLVYDYPKTKPLPRYWEYEYRYKTYKTLNERLLKAGVRLAAWLEENL